MDSANPIPVITVIGTCRVHHPLRQMANEGLIQLNNGGLGSFVHSTPEALIRLKVLLELDLYDSNIVKLQVGESKELVLGPESGYDFTESDLLVVEVSTIKTVTMKNNPLQVNEINRHLCTPFGEYGKELKSNLNHAFNNRESHVREPSSEVPSDFPSEYLDVIRTLHPVVQDIEKLSIDLDEIRRLAKIPVLLVNHINLPGKDGKLITSRNKLCNMMSSYAEKNSVPLFNPSEMFVEQNPCDLLMDQGEDLNHYSKEHLGLVGKIQLKALLEML